MKELSQIIEAVHPAGFITSAMRWCSLGHPMKNSETMLRAFCMKAVYDIPTTKGMIEMLKINLNLRRLCGWEYRWGIPSEATFSRAFDIFAKERICDMIHESIVQKTTRIK